MRELEDLRALLRDENSIDLGVLAGAFENRSKEDKKYKLHIIVFSSFRPPTDLFHEWCNTEFSFSVDHFKDFDIIYLSRIINKKRLVEGSFGLSRFRKSNIWIAFTSEPLDFFENGVIKFLESYRPDISRIYLSSNELRELFEKVEGALLSKIHVKKAILYSYIGEGEISYKKKHFQEIFDAAEDEYSYVDRVEYDIREDETPNYHGLISRNMICYYRSGRMNYFLDHILPLISNIARRKLDLLDNKERDPESAEAKLLTLSFSRGMFKDKNYNFKLIKILETISGGAIAVYHGNPYLHLSFLDFIDGSNFDIFVTDPNNITIVPNFKCSAYSLMRVTDHIFKGLEEGAIKLAERYTYSAADFMTE